MAGAIARRQLGSAALLGLDVGRPLSLLAGQLIWLSQPLLGLFSASSLARSLALLLEEPAGVDRLIAQLELQVEPPEAE
ncbi:MAG: hypothetical protein ACRDHL_01625 [Candidatus Promineifilaceae bacterium]